MLRILANIVSLVVNPLMAPTFLFALLLFYFPELQAVNTYPGKLNAIGFIFISTFLFSFLLIFLLYKLKMVARVTLENQKDRTIPQLFLSGVYLIITGILVNRYGWKDGLSLGMLACTLTILSITVINRFWKISTHASGISGVFAIMTVLYIRFAPSGFGEMYGVICIITLGVCLSRLYLKVHTPMQVVAGFFLGGISGALLFLFR